MDGRHGGERRWQQQIVDSPAGTFIVRTQSGDGAQRECVDVFARSACHIGDYGFGRQGADIGSMGRTRAIAAAIRSFHHDDHGANRDRRGAVRVADVKWIGIVPELLVEALESKGGRVAEDRFRTANSAGGKPLIGRYSEIKAGRRHRKRA